jgi:hypothetical protein
VVEERVDVSIGICDGFGAEIDDEGDVDQTGESINPRTFIIHHKNPLQNWRSLATTQSSRGRDGINSEGNLFSGFYRF